MIRLVAGLLIMTQLQPLAGAILCLPAVHLEQEECMPSDQQPSTPASSATLATHAQNCPTIGLCAPTGMALIAQGNALSVVQPADGEGRVADSASMPQVAHAPPFHPPRA
jgi:predicted cobalt transporter CbtA